MRGKIGLPPSRGRGVLGSYSASARLLTLVRYDKPKGATDYVNSMWEAQKEPYGGDVVNSYNDGPTEPGKPSLGGFYEIETSSPAAALAPGAALSHVHQTYHFTESAQFCGMIWLEPLVVHGAPQLDEAALEAFGTRYRAYLVALSAEEIDGHA